MEKTIALIEEKIKWLEEALEVGEKFFLENSDKISGKNYIFIRAQDKRHLSDLQEILQSLKHEAGDVTNIDNDLYEAYYKSTKKKK